MPEWIVLVSVVSMFALMTFWSFHQVFRTLVSIITYVNDVLVDSLTYHIYSLRIILTYIIWNSVRNVILL